MFIVITGLDGSGTSSLASNISKLDKKSVLFKTPSSEFGDRDMIDDKVRSTSKYAHCLYYLSSVVYISDFIKDNYDLSSQNVYCVRYLIDTVVSNRVSGVNIPFEYSVFGHEILKPDVTVFVYTPEDLRQERISSRGKSKLDVVLDDVEKMNKFNDQFRILLPEETIYVKNDDTPIYESARDTYTKISSYIRKRK